MLCKYISITPAIIFQIKYLATSIIFTIFQLYFIFSFLVRNPLEATSSNLHLEYIGIIQQYVGK
jgi:hypothetical protein